MYVFSKLKLVVNKTYIYNPKQVSMFTKLLKELEASLHHAKKNAPAVSHRGVDWHLDHTLKIINSICETLKKSNPDEFKPKFSLMKSFILFTGYIPRGKGKSPAPFNNKGTIDEENLKVLLQEAKESLESLDDLPQNSHFPHPYFGSLNLKQAKKFIAIHSNHHLKIIKDIVSKS